MELTDLPIMTPEQVAELLQCSVPTLRKLVRAGKLREITVGPRTRRYRRADVEAYLEGEPDGRRSA